MKLKCNTHKRHFDVATKHFEASKEIQRTGDDYFKATLAYFKKRINMERTKYIINEAKTLANANSQILNSEVMKSTLKNINSAYSADGPPISIKGEAGISTGSIACQPSGTQFFRSVSKCDSLMPQKTLEI